MKSFIIEDPYSVFPPEVHCTLQIFSHHKYNMNLSKCYTLSNISNILNAKTDCASAMISDFQIEIPENIA